MDAHALKIMAALAVFAVVAVSGVASAVAGVSDGPPAGSTAKQGQSEDDGDEAEARPRAGNDAAEGGDADERQDANGAGGGQRQLQAKGPLDPGRFSTRVSHPLVPLSSVPITIFKGLERQRGADVQVRSESRLLKQTARIAGVRVAVVEVKEFENGALIERTLDYYAQRDDGTVWYFGERVDDYESGQIVGHGGQWFAGRGGAKPGLFMPARPTVGLTFEQERAPGVAEDRSTVIAVRLTVRTPAGKFSDCIKTKDFAPIDNKTEFKFYCRGVGLVREQAPGVRLELVRYR